MISTDTTTCKYLAFISYNHADKAQAVRLQHFLTEFCAPEAELGRFAVHTQGAVFRDETHLALGGLGEEITKALEASRYLIVLCSPKSARPNQQGKCWVDEEVETFLAFSEQRRSCVIPLVLRRAMGAAKADYIPKSLRRHNIAALCNINRDGEDGAFCAVAARILQMPEKQLRARLAARLFLRRTGRRCGAVAAALCLGAASWWGWDYEVPHTVCFGDYIVRKGVPAGMFPLSAKEQQRADFSYYITSRHHHVVRVECRDNRGALVLPSAPGHEDRPAAADFSYTDGGLLRERVEYDVRGHTVCRCEYGKGGVESYFDPETGCVKDASYFSAPNNRAVRPGWRGVERTEQELAADGSVTCNVFTNHRGNKVKSVTGICGIRYTRDARGLVTETQYLQEDGTAGPDSDGVVRVVYARDENGMVTSVRRLNAGGAPATSPDGVAERRYTWKDRHLVSECAFDASGNLVLP